MKRVSEKARWMRGGKKKHSLHSVTMYDAKKKAKKCEKARSKLIRSTQTRLKKKRGGLQTGTLQTKETESR